MSGLHDGRDEGLSWQVAPATPESVFPASAKTGASLSGAGGLYARPAGLTRAITVSR